MTTTISDFGEAGWQATAAAPQPFSLTCADRGFLRRSLGLLLAVRLLAAFWLPFVDTTEARYAEIARKMLETGDWITPQFDYGVPFWGKPPLHTWLSALGMDLFGVGPFGARIFILCAALIVVGLVYAFVRRHQGADQALLASTVLASAALFFGASAFVMTDMAMMLGTTLCMVGFFNAIAGGSAHRIWGSLFFVGIAIGMLAKGPVAVVITVLPLTVWLSMAGRWRGLRNLPWRSGLLIAAVLTLPWYIAAEIRTPGFLRYFFVGEHFDRFVVSGWQGDLYGSGHARPKGMIWLYWLMMFLPWTLFAVALLPHLRVVRAVVSRDYEGFHSYLALWAVSPLILFTPAANILAAYVLPGLPAAAILLVSLWTGTFQAPGKWTRIFSGMAIGAVAMPFMVVTVLAYVAPQSLHLKTERDLVAAAQAIDPAVRFTYWGKRSYSAEFYTAGQVVFTADAETIRALGSNALRDAVAIPETEAGRLALLLADQFRQVGHYGRRVLFIEPAAQEIGR